MRFLQWMLFRIFVALKIRELKMWPCCTVVYSFSPIWDHLAESPPPLSFGCFCSLWVCIRSPFQWEEWTMKDCTKSIRRIISAPDERWAPDARWKVGAPQRWNWYRTQAKSYILLNLESISTLIDWKLTLGINMSLKRWCGHMATNNLAHHCKTFDWCKKGIFHWSISYYLTHMILWMH